MLCYMRTYNYIISLRRITGVRILCADVSEHCPILIGRVNKACSHDLSRWDSVPKRLHIKFARRGVTQKKELSIHKTAKV